MSKVDEMVSEGIELSLSSELSNQEIGRSLLESASALGRDDATFNLGKLYERRKEYLQAEECYTRGFDRRYRAAVFRLAVLHGKGLVEHSDNQFYLNTIKALSKDFHFPSLALYTNECFRGSFGSMSRVKGLLIILPSLLLYFYFHIKNPSDSRFEE